MNANKSTATADNLAAKLSAISGDEACKDYTLIDTALINECVDFIAEIDGRQHLSKQEVADRVGLIPFSSGKRRIRLRNLLIAAAVIVALLIAALTVSSKFFDFDIPYELYEHFTNSIRLNNGKTQTRVNTYELDGTDTAELFSEHGIEHIIMPTALLKGAKVEITDVKTSNLVTAVSFKCSGGEYYSYGVVTNYVGNDFSPQTNISHPNSGKMVSTEKTDVFCFQMARSAALLIYSDDAVSYQLQIDDCTLDEACEIAMTII